MHLYMYKFSMLIKIITYGKDLKVLMGIWRFSSENIVHKIGMIHMKDVFKQQFEIGKEK